MKFVFALLVGACSRSTEPAPSPRAAPGPSVSVASAVFAPSASASPPKPPCITPESVGAAPLVELKGSSELERRALRAARAELESVLEKPREFFATVQATDDLVLLELWHRSAFLPENCNDVGNPGGKCRTLGYDPKRGRVTSTKFWQ